LFFFFYHFGQRRKPGLESGEGPTKVLQKQQTKAVGAAKLRGRNATHCQGHTVLLSYHCYSSYVYRN